MASRTGPAVLQVHIFRDGDFLGTDVFSERQIVVGRDPDEADLVLESSQVSRKHAIIENDSGKLSVRDAGSTNGVYVNADKIEGTVEVTRLDEIRIGDFSLKLKLAGKNKSEAAVRSSDDSTGQMAAVMPESSVSQSVSQSVSSARLEARTMIDVPTERRESLERVDSRAEAQRREELRREEERIEEERREDERREAQRREDATRRDANRSPARSNPDLSEFDDLLDEPTSTQAARSPSAEFRKRAEPVDRDKLGDMLAGIGIEGGMSASASVHAPTRIDKAYQRPVDLAGDLEGPEPETRVDIGALADEPSATGVNGRSSHFGGARAAAPIPRAEPDAESLISGSPTQARGLPKAPDVFGLDGDPMQAFEPHAELTHDDDDDHDHDDEDFEPQYSLAEHILNDDHPAKDGVPRVEVLGVRNDVVESVTLLAPGEAFWVGPPPALARLMMRTAQGDANYVAGPRYELVKHKKPGEVEVEFKKDARGMLVRGGRSIDLNAVGAKSNKKQERRGTQMMGLTRGEIAQINEGPVTYHVRHVIAPAQVRDNRPFLTRIRPERLLLISAGAAFFGHIFALLFFSLVAGHAVPPEPAHEEFVEVTIEPEMKLEEPPPPPPEPEPEPTPPAPEPVAQQKPVPQKVPKNVKLPKTAATPPPPNPAPTGVLGLLNKTGAKTAPGPASAVAAISNLAAAKTPSGSSGYKVSGLIGKLPTSDLSIGGGGGGGPVTKGAAALLRGGGGGAGAITGKVGGKVGGLVTKMPGQMRAAGGSLDRDEIQKVVNKHVGEIQRCYERELLKTPGLSGKVTIEWVVSTSGSVKSSRQKDSTMQSAAAVNCMLGSVKGWQFPTPKGGEVVVSYPFNFSPIGM